VRMSGDRDYPPISAYQPQQRDYVSRLIIAFYFTFLLSPPHKPWSASSTRSGSRIESDSIASPPVESRQYRIQVAEAGGKWVPRVLAVCVFNQGLRPGTPASCCPRCEPADTENKKRHAVAAGSHLQKTLLDVRILGALAGGIRQLSQLHTTQVHLLLVVPHVSLQHNTRKRVSKWFSE
jgi:hypothetical protein